MSNEIKLKAQARPEQEQGSGAARRLRRAGGLPGALNRIGGGTAAIKLDAHEFEMAMRYEASEHLLVTIDLDGTPVTALMREVQHHVMTGKAIHVDFGEVDLTRRIRVTIGLRLVGEPEGVRVGGGVLEQTLREIEVECLPTDIVESFDVNVEALPLNESIFVKDLQLGDKYAIVTHGDIAVATVAKPDEEVEAPAPAEGEQAAPEVIQKGKKDEEGAADAAPAKK